MNLESLTRTNTEISSGKEQLSQQTSNSIKNAIINPIQTQLLKTASVSVKPFDPPISNSTTHANSSNSGEKSYQSTQQQQQPIQPQPQQSFTPGLISRDNSTLANNQLSRYNTIMSSTEHMVSRKRQSILILIIF